MSSSRVSKVVGEQIATSARKRKNRIVKLNADVPSLKEFMHKHRVLKQYRDFLRALKFIPDDEEVWRAQMKGEVKDTFRSRLKEFDKQAISMAVIDGDRKLTQLRAMVGISHQESVASDSWLNITDDEDKRGRIGNKWPWE